MKSVTLETHDKIQHNIDHVTSVHLTGDFTVITAKRPNGQTESHRFATYTIQRLSEYDKTNVAEVPKAAKVLS